MKEYFGMSIVLPEKGVIKILAYEYNVTSECNDSCVTSESNN